MSRFIRLTLVLLLGACRGTDGEGPAVPNEAPASADVICAEHGVLEAICTRCHPELIPIFQSKGDWCNTHSFPESVCPQCHPERGGRPARDVSQDAAPADGTVIRFASPEIARRVGIETATAAAATVTRTLRVTGRVVYDARRLATVDARIASVVEAVRVEVGSVVEVGAPLAGLRSTQLATALARHDGTRARVRILKTQLDRKRRLAADGIATLNEVFVAEEAWTEARAELAALRAELAIVTPVGDSDAALSFDDGIFEVHAPIAGVVVARTVNAGSAVSADDPLFTIADPSVVWVELDVPEHRAAEIQPGLRAEVRCSALGETPFAGVIDHVSPAVDPHTRMVVARLAIENPDGLLRANMFATATIALAAPVQLVRVPRAAVQRIGGREVVFVTTGIDRFESRRVRLLEHDGAIATLSDGLAPGEEVVTTGSFLLKTEVMKDSIGAGCCEVD